MAKQRKKDSLGAGYWALSDELKRLGGELTDDFLPLRSIFQRAHEDLIKIHASVTWEKLVVFQILEVDIVHKDDLYVRRGSKWGEFWNENGDQITGQEISLNEFLEELGECKELIDSSKNDSE